MSEERSIIDITRMDITAYTEYEFEMIIDHLYEGRFSDEWTAEAEAMFEKVVAHPDGLSLIYDGDHPYIIYEDLKTWYKEQGLPFTKLNPDRPITDYTEQEFLALVKSILNVKVYFMEEDFFHDPYNVALKDYPDAWRHISGLPKYASTPEEIIRMIKQWYNDNNKPCFKSE